MELMHNHELSIKILKIVASLFVSETNAYFTENIVSAL